MSGSSLEAVKLLKDWSTWLLGIQVALTAYLNSALASHDFTGSAFLIKTAVLFFASSIFFSGLLLGGLPTLVNEEPQPTASLYERTLKLSEMPLYNVRSLVTGQHACFLGGILVLLFAILMRP